MFAKMDILEVKSLNFFVLLRSFDAELIKIVGLRSEVCVGWVALLRLVHSVP